MTEPTSEPVRLQPLRIPAGWHMVYNCGLWELDPTSNQIPNGDEGYYFNEDMLQLRHPSLNRLLDVGWYPEGDLELGRYVIEVYQGDFHGTLLHRFESRDRHVLVSEIERLLEEHSTATRAKASGDVTL